MELRNLDDSDRKMLLIFGVIGLVLMVGLTVTGIVQFFTHAADPSWERYVVGSSIKPFPQPSTGLADAHGVLGDLSALFTLLVVAWWSYRVIARVSWVGVTSLVTMVGALIVGGLIPFNAVALEGEVDVEVQGYPQIFGGGVDTMVTDRYDLGIMAARFWTVVHIVSLPLILALVFGAWKAAKTRTENAPRPDDSWLDQLG